MKKNVSPFSRVLSYLPGLGIILLSLAILAIVVPPRVQSIQENSAKITDLEEQVKSLSLKVTTLSSIDAAELVTLETKAEIAVPKEKTFAGLLTGLDALSKEAGSIIMSFDSAPGLISTTSGLISTISAQPTPPPPPGNAIASPSGLLHLEAGISLNSNVSSLISLASKLANSGRLVTLEKIDYSSIISGAKSANTNILLRVYYQPGTSARGVSQLSVVPLTSAEKELIAKVDSLNRFVIDVPSSLPSNLDPFSTPQTATSSPSPQI